MYAINFIVAIYIIRWCEARLLRENFLHIIKLFNCTIPFLSVEMEKIEIM